MKKTINIFVILMFAICPAVLHADPVAVQTQYVDPAHLSSGTNATSNLPEYQTHTIYDTDKQGVASAAYAKGAYNSAIRAINKVANIADSKLPSNIDTSSTGAIVTSISKNQSGEMVVSKGEISVPVADSAPTVASGRAAIWVQ